MRYIKKNLKYYNGRIVDYQTGVVLNKILPTITPQPILYLTSNLRGYALFQRVYQIHVESYPNNLFQYHI